MSTPKNSNIEYKARSILTQLEFKGERTSESKEKSIILQDDKSSKAYCEIHKIQVEGKEKILLTVLNEEKFKQHLKMDPIFGEMVQQIHIYNKINNKTENIPFGSSEANEAIFHEKFILGKAITKECDSDFKFRS